MTVILPTEYESMRVQEIRPGRPITDRQAGRIFENQALIYARNASLTGGRTEIFRRRETSFGVVDDVTGLTEPPQNVYNLNLFQPLVHLYREQDGDIVELEVSAFGEDFELRVNVFEVADKNFIGQFTLENDTATPAWVTESETFDLSDFESGGEIFPAALYFEARSTGISDCIIYRIQPSEAVITSAADLP